MQKIKRHKYRIEENLKKNWIYFILENSMHCCGVKITPPPVIFPVVERK